jgi:hypothetical protein
LLTDIIPGTFFDLRRLPILSCLFFNRLVTHKDLFFAIVPSKIQGGRTAEEISAYMIKKSGPAVTTVKSVEEAEAFFAKQPTAALALLDSLDSDIALAVTTFAESSDNVPFAYTAEPAVLTNYGAKAGSLRFVTPEAVFTRSLDFSGGVTAFEELNAWLFGHSIAPMFEFSPEKSMHLFSGPIRVHLIAFGDATEAGFADTVAAIKEGASEFRTKALSILVGKNETRILEAFDLTEKDVPTMVIADMRAGAMKRFFFEGDMAKAFDTQKFLTNFFAGHLKAKLKSEEPVPEDMEKAVKVIKGKSFQKEVLESDKDVLMEFYAPWCGHWCVEGKAGGCKGGREGRHVTARATPSCPVVSPPERGSYSLSPSRFLPCPIAKPWSPSGTCWATDSLVWST